MDLQKDITDYIKTIGVPAAAEYFGKAEGTIKQWVKTKGYPLLAIQKYMDQLSPEKASPEPFNVTEPLATLAFPDETHTAISSSTETRLTAIEQYLGSLNQPVDLDTRIMTIESFLKGQNPTTESVVAVNPNLPWYPPGPKDSNVTSMVRPGSGVPVKAAFGVPTVVPPAAPSVAPRTPASTWLDPIKPRV